MHPTADAITAAFCTALGTAPPCYRIAGAPCWLAVDIAHALATTHADVERALDRARDRLAERRHWGWVVGTERQAIADQVRVAGPGDALPDALLVLLTQAVLEVPLWLESPAARRVAPALRRLIPFRPLGLTIDEAGVVFGLPAPGPDLRLIDGAN